MRELPDPEVQIEYVDRDPRRDILAGRPCHTCPIGAFHVGLSRMAPRTLREWHATGCPNLAAVRRAYAGSGDDDDERDALFDDENYSCWRSNNDPEKLAGGGAGFGMPEPDRQILDLLKYIARRI